MYEALHPYMEVFDNTFVSFFKQCLTYKLISNPKDTKEMSDE